MIGDDAIHSQWPVIVSSSSSSSHMEDDVVPGNLSNHQILAGQVFAAHRTVDSQDKISYIYT